LELRIARAEELKSLIRQLPDYPVKGVIFLDITPVFKDAEAMKFVIDEQSKLFRKGEIDLVAGVEARGFIVGAPLAYKLGVGFVPIRKPGKLPWKKKKVTYQLEYGEEAVEIHIDAVSMGQNVLLVDDLLATGGTAKAAASLIEELGGKVKGISFIVELEHLKGREKLSGYNVYSLIKYRKGDGVLV
jgi:adenine phosphoribosyltransferase (EC 2.4.2.7)